MRRLLQEISVLILGVAVAAAQSNATTAQQQAPSTVTSLASQMGAQELSLRIASYEGAIRSGEAQHADHGSMAKLYAGLGNLYASAGLYLKAEDAIKRAIADLKDGPRADLANEFGQLAIVHVELEKTKEAERDELEALRVREALGDPVHLALTWTDLAGLYSIQHKFDKAAEYAQKAYDAESNLAGISADDRVAVRQTLGFALTGNKNCERGIPILKDALDLAKQNFGDLGQPVGYSEYLLGFGYWHCGDEGHAAEWLRRGTTDMRADYGWNRTLYVNAMSQYARFLRTTGRLEEAASAVEVVKQADAIVDARSMTGMAQGFRSVGTK